MCRSNKISLILITALKRKEKKYWTFFPSKFLFYFILFYSPLRTPILPQWLKNFQKLFISSIGQHDGILLLLLLIFWHMFHSRLLYLEGEWDRHIHPLNPHHQSSIAALCRDKHFYTWSLPGTSGRLSIYLRDKYWLICYIFIWPFLQEAQGSRLGPC